MVERISALNGHYSKGSSGKNKKSGIKIYESKNLLFICLYIAPILNPFRSKIGTQTSQLLV